MRRRQIVHLNQVQEEMKKEFNVSMNVLSTKIQSMVSSKEDYTCPKCNVSKFDYLVESKLKDEEMEKDSTKKPIIKRKRKLRNEYVSADEVKDCG